MDPPKLAPNSACQRALSPGQSVGFGGQGRGEITEEEKTLGSNAYLGLWCLTGGGGGGCQNENKIEGTLIFNISIGVTVGRFN